MTDLTHEQLVARAIVAENATAITQLSIISGLATGLGSDGATFARQRDEYLGNFPRVVERAKHSDPRVPWEVCVEIAVQHEVHKFHGMYPGAVHGAVYLAAATSMAQRIKNTVYMAEKAEATVH